MTDSSLIQMAYARLIGLQGNIPDPDKTAHLELIELFHEIIEDLQALGVDLSKFHIPESAINQSHYTGKRWCRASLLRAKVDGLLALFQVSDDKQRIGFIPSSTQQ